MNTSITIDMPEVAQFDPQELALKINYYIKNLAAKMHKDKSPEEVINHKDWRNMVISPEVKAMTFDHRVDFGTTDYDKLLENALEEKYL